MNIHTNIHSSIFSLSCWGSSHYRGSVGSAGQSSFQRRLLMSKIPAVKNTMSNYSIQCCSRTWHTCSRCKRNSVQNSNSLSSLFLNDMIIYSFNHSSPFSFSYHLFPYLISHELCFYTLPEDGDRMVMLNVSLPPATAKACNFGLFGPSRSLLMPLAATYSDTTVKERVETGKDDIADDEDDLADGSPILLDGELLEDDELLSTAGTEITGGDGDGLIGSLDDYEAMLEGSLLGEDTEYGSAVGDVTHLPTEEGLLSSSASITAPQKSVSELQRLVLSLLPDNGEPVLITSITPGLDDDMEHICEKYKSLLDFLRVNCASIVAVEKARRSENEASSNFSPRWMVRKKVSSYVESTHLQMKVVETKFFKSEENVIKKKKQSNTRRLVSITAGGHEPGYSDTLLSDSDVSLLVKAFIDQVFNVKYTEVPIPENSEEVRRKSSVAATSEDCTSYQVVSVFDATARLDPSLKGRIKDNYRTITGFLKRCTVVSETIDVASDGLRIGFPKGAIASKDLLASGLPSTHREPDSADDESPWIVDLGIGEDEMEDAEILRCHTSKQPGTSESAFDDLLTESERQQQLMEAPTAMDENLGEIEVRYDGVDLQECATMSPSTIISKQEASRIPSAPAAPKMGIEASQLSNATKDHHEVSLTRSAALKMQALHTALAEEKGWKTPQEMLDLFVSAIPTYFVAISHLTIPSELQSAIGKNTLYKVFKAYCYFFDLKVENGTHFVKLKDFVEHPLKGGDTDEIYVHLKGRKTRAINHQPHGAPLLCKLFDKSGSLSQYVQKKKKMWMDPASKKVPDAPPVRQALRHVIPFDRYVAITPEIVDAVKLEAYRLKAELRVQRMRVAIAVSSSSGTGGESMAQNKDNVNDKSNSSDVTQRDIVSSTNDGVQESIHHNVSSVTEGNSNSNNNSTTQTNLNKDSAIETIGIDTILHEVTTSSKADYLVFPPLPTAHEVKLMKQASNRDNETGKHPYDNDSASMELTAGLHTSTAQTLVRLRPFWIAPFATGDYTADTSPLTVPKSWNGETSVGAGEKEKERPHHTTISNMKELISSVAAHIRSVGLWTTEGRILERLPIDVAVALERVFYYNADIINGMHEIGDINGEHAASLTQKTKGLHHLLPVDLISFLRLHGGVFWVDCEVPVASAHTTPDSINTPYISTSNPVVSNGAALHRSPSTPIAMSSVSSIPGKKDLVVGTSVTPSDSSLVEKRVRKYAAFDDLDDIQHILVDEIRRALTRLQVEAKYSGKVNENSTNPLNDSLVAVRDMPQLASSKTPTTGVCTGTEFALEIVRDALPSNLRMMLDPIPCDKKGDEVVGQRVSGTSRRNTSHRPSSSSVSQCSAIKACDYVMRTPQEIEEGFHNRNSNNDYSSTTDYITSALKQRHLKREGRMYSNDCVHAPEVDVLLNNIMSPKEPFVQSVAPECANISTTNNDAVSISPVSSSYVPPSSIRRPTQARLLKFLKDHKKYFDTRVESVSELVVVHRTPEEIKAQRARDKALSDRQKDEIKLFVATGGKVPINKLGMGHTNRMPATYESGGAAGGDDEYVVKQYIYISPVNIFSRQQERVRQCDNGTSSSKEKAPLLSPESPKSSNAAPSQSTWDPRKASTSSWGSLGKKSI